MSAMTNMVHKVKTPEDLSGVRSHWRTVPPNARLKAYYPFTQALKHLSYDLNTQLIEADEDAEKGPLMDFECSVHEFIEEVDQFRSNQARLARNKNKTRKVPA